MTEVSYTFNASPRRERTWYDSAACREIGHQPFYAEGHPSMVAAEHRRALAVCRTCPVQAECLEHALATDERFGVWGGTTEAQRAQMKRGRDTPLRKVNHLINGSGYDPAATDNRP